MKIISTWNKGKRAYDVLNEAGYWVAWLTTDASGALRLMSTGAPLEDAKRATLARKIGAKMSIEVQS